LINVCKDKLSMREKILNLKTLMMFHHQYFFQVPRFRPVKDGSSLSLLVKIVLRDRSSLLLKPSQRKIPHFRINLTLLQRILVRLVCMPPDLSSIFSSLEISLRPWSSESSHFSKNLKNALKCKQNRPN